MEQTLPRELCDHVEWLALAERHVLARLLLRAETSMLWAVQRHYGHRMVVGTSVRERNASLRRGMERAIAFWEGIHELEVTDCVLDACCRAHHDVWWQMCEESSHHLPSAPRLCARLQRAMEATLVAKKRVL